MRPVLVFPNEERREFPSKAGTALRYHNPARGLVVQGPDEALNQGEASMYPNRAVPRTDRLALTAAFESLVPEDTAVPSGDAIRTHSWTDESMTDANVSWKRANRVAVSDAG